MIRDPFDKLSADIDNKDIKECDIGEIIRSIPVDLLTYKRSMFEAKAYIVQDTSNHILTGKVTDRKTKKSYHFSFNSQWLDEKNADWLAGVVCRIIADTIYKTKENYKNQLKESFKNIFDLGDIKVA